MIDERVLMRSTFREKQAFVHSTVLSFSFFHGNVRKMLEKLEFH